MQNKWWGDTNLGRSDSIKVRDQGCYLIGFAMALSGLRFENEFNKQMKWETPGSINAKKLYKKTDFVFTEQTSIPEKISNKYNLQFDYWTKGVQGNLENKIQEYDDSSTKYAILGKVAWDKKNPKEANHWIGIEGAPIYDPDLGEEMFVHIVGTSQNDVLATRPSFWKEKDGSYYIPTSEIYEIHVFSEKTTPYIQYEE